MRQLRPLEKAVYGNRLTANMRKLAAKATFRRPRKGEQFIDSNGSQLLRATHMSGFSEVRFVIAAKVCWNPLKEKR